MTITLDQVNMQIGKAGTPFDYTYTERDVALYALGVGAPADPLDQDELQFVYELSGQGFKVLPSFAVIYTSEQIHQILSGRIGDIEYNPMMLVHGEQAVELKKPLPAEGTVRCYPTVTDIFDKGSGMLVVNDIVCKDDQDEEIAVLRSSMFIRGMGGFGGERGTSEKVNVPPERDPDAVMTEQTSENQALIYRLSGDVNPLHADPAMAAIGNFERPILHGLCTFGYATRAILKHFCGNDPAKMQAISVRFSKHVFPGETLVTEMWHEGNGKIIFQTKVRERDEIVLSYAGATIAE